MKNIFALLIIIFSTPSYANPLNSKEERYHTNRLFYEEYYVYNADSAMRYVDENLKIATELKRKDWFYA